MRSDKIHQQRNYLHLSALLELFFTYNFHLLTLVVMFTLQGDFKMSFDGAAVWVVSLYSVLAMVGNDDGKQHAMPI